MVKKEKIRQVTKIPFTNHLGRYLDFNVKGRLLKMNSKLASWKGRLLNKPGRLTLATSMLASMPTSGIQLQWLLQSICGHVDRLVQNFTWKGNDEKGLNMVSWKELTKRKKDGGLGVLNSRHHNTTLLGKLI